MTADAATVDRTTAELGQVVDARRIAELPIREGSPVELVILAPGVTVTTDLRSRKAAFNNGLSQFSTDGVGEKKNDFTIDGVSNVANDRVAYSPPSASVEEFKIHTTSYDAAIGNTMGAVVNLVTKSGTNALRGQVYEWFRGAALDARNYFDRARRPAEARLRGQPVRRRGRRPDPVEPDVLLRQRRGEPVQGPVAEHRDGADGEDAHRRLLGSARARPAVSDLQPVHDPAASDAGGPVHPRSVPRQHHPARPDRSGREEDPRVSSRCRTRRARPTASRTYQNPTAVAFETYYTATGRVDHNISAKHRIYGRFSWDFWEEEKDDRFDNIATGIFLNRKNRILGVDDAYTIRNNLLMNVRGGFTRQMFPERRRSQGFDLSTLGFSPQLVSLAPKDIATFPFINYDGFQDFGVSESGDG